MFDGTNEGESQLHSMPENLDKSNREGKLKKLFEGLQTKVRVITD